MSRSRDGRYYEDSDDMVERIRRAKGAFEKKTKAFQGPDWPYYEKRIIVGQKKKEDMDLAQAPVSATPGNAEANPVLPETNSFAAAEPAQPTGQAASTAADDTSAWWAAQRAAQKLSKTALDSSPAADESQDLEDGGAS